MVKLKTTNLYHNSTNIHHHEILRMIIIDFHNIKTNPFVHVKIFAQVSFIKDSSKRKQRTIIKENHETKQFFIDILIKAKNLIDYTSLKINLKSPH